MHIEGLLRERRAQLRVNISRLSPSKLMALFWQHFSNILKSSCPNLVRLLGKRRPLAGNDLLFSALELRFPFFLMTFQFKPSQSSLPTICSRIATNSQVADDESQRVLYESIPLSRTSKLSPYGAPVVWLEERDGSLK